MFDENEHTHPQNNDEGPRHIHRGIKRSEPDEVEVDSADFFSPEPPRPKAPPKPTPTPPSEPPKPPVPPRRQWEPLHPSEPALADDKLPKGGMVLLGLQAVLSLAALVQLWRTQMLPVLYLVIITALLVLLWLLVKRCQEYNVPGKVSRVFSVVLCAAMAVGQEVFLVSPVQAVRTLLQLLPQAEFWQRVGFSSGRILLGFGLGVAVSIVLAVAAQAWHTADVLLAPVLQLVKATPVASFIILALVWVRGASLSVLISFLMVLPVLYGAVRTGIQSADPQLLEMTKVFRLPLGRRLRAVWLPAVLPAFRQGCSVALGICWKSGVAAEVIGLPDGSIGDALYRAKITLSTGELFAWTFVIILLSAGFEKLFLLLLDCVTRAVTGEVPQC